MREGCLDLRSPPLVHRSHIHIYVHIYMYLYIHTLDKDFIDILETLIFIIVFIIVKFLNDI